MTKKEAEMALSVAISQYVQARMTHALEHEGFDENNAFLSGVIHAIEFCAGSVMTCFLLASRRGPEGDQVDLREVEDIFRDMMEKATGFVCDTFPKQLAAVDDILSRDKA